MTDMFKFTPVRMGAPEDNLCAAIGIIQSEILAADTGLDPRVMFGNDHFARAGLETAVALLVPLIEAIESLRWNGGKT